MSIVESGPKVDNSQEALIRQAASNSTSIALDVIVDRYKTAGKFPVGRQNVTAFIQNNEGGKSFPVDVSWSFPDDPQQRVELEKLIEILRDVNLSVNPRDYLEPWQQDLLNETGVLPSGDLKTAKDLLDQGKQKMQRVRLGILSLTTPSIQTDSSGFLRPSPPTVEPDLGKIDSAATAGIAAATTLIAGRKLPSMVKAGILATTGITVFAACAPQDIASGTIVVDKGEVQVIPEAPAEPTEPPQPTASPSPEPTKTPEATKTPGGLTEVHIGTLTGKVIEVGVAGGGAQPGTELEKIYKASPLDFVVVHNGIPTAGYQIEEEGKTKEGQMLAFGTWDGEKWVGLDGKELGRRQVVEDRAFMRTISTTSEEKPKVDDKEIGILSGGEIVALTGESVGVEYKGAKQFFQILRPSGRVDLTQKPEAVAASISAYVGDIGLEEVEQKAEKKELYPTAFELPLATEVDIEGVKISVDLMFRLTENFAKETGYKGIELAEPDKIADVAKIAVYGAYAGYRWGDADKINERQNVSVKDWMQLVKEGKAEEMQPVLNEAHLDPENRYDGGRKLLPWSPTVASDGEITMRIGLTYAGGKDPLPLKLTTQEGMNLTLKKERLIGVFRFMNTLKDLQKRGAKLSGDPDTDRNLGDDTFSSDVFRKLISVFCVNEEAALTHNPSLDIWPQNPDRAEFNKQKLQEISFPMGNGTMTDYSDDHPIFRLTK